MVSPLASGLEDPHRPLVLSAWKRPANAQPRASRTLTPGGSRGAARVNEGRVVVDERQGRRGCPMARSFLMRGADGSWQPLKKVEKRH